MNKGYGDRVRTRRNRPRVIGTFNERILALQAAQRVLETMKKSHEFADINLDSLSTTIVGFLREPAPQLLGFCSYSTKGNQNGRSSNPGERTWRILVNRKLVHARDGELEATIYHEYLHAVLGHDENHGPNFQALESLWPLSTQEVEK